MKIIIHIQRIFLVCIAVLATLGICDLPHRSEFFLWSLLVGVVYVFLPLFFLAVSFSKSRVGFWCGALSWIVFPPLIAFIVGFLTSDIPLLSKLAEFGAWMLIPIALAITWTRSADVSRYYRPVLR